MASWPLLPGPSKKRCFRGILLALFLSLLLTRGQGQAAPKFVTRVYLSEEAALKIAFPSSERFIKERKILKEDLKKKVEERLGKKLKKSLYNFYIAKSQEKVDGYALVDEEKGKYLPITFLTSTDPSGRVKDVQVLVYREPEGDQIQRKSYLHQYVGKTSQDSLRIPHDIVHITGATISCRSITEGVKRSLVLVEAVYLKNSHP